MEPFVRVSGRAAPLPTPNLDTDVIMPKTFLKGVDRKGLALGAFHLLRFIGGTPNPDFILNRPGYRGARFLVVGPNFGCGSSREHAVWGLCQLGIRALIGTTFAGIFDDNCQNNGLLTLSLAPEQLAMLLERVAHPDGNRLTIDLPDQRILVEATGETLAFDVPPARKERLLNGLDAVSATLRHADEIRAFEARHRTAHPWFYGAV
jgi:3-isopropylmalate/(R)-2-methylmalate dehydratase small subunit